jgi:hypothetical protein
VEVLPSITILSVKTDEKGIPVRKKARCVVRGDMQSESPDDGPTHSSPVARFSTFRIMSSKAAITGCELQQMDVCTAFLHAPLDRPTFLAIPAGFPDSELIVGVPRSNQVLRLKKAVYGLKDAPHSWYAHCAGIFVNNDFTRSDNDHCLFYAEVPSSHSTAYVLVYVDDFTLLAHSVNDMACVLTWTKALKGFGACGRTLVIIYTNASKGPNVQASELVNALRAERTK